jgi:hypothetical protein
MLTITPMMRLENIREGFILIYLCYLQNHRNCVKYPIFWGYYEFLF